MGEGIEFWDGFVLAGGGSRRMGVDKARLDWRGRPLYRHQMETLANAGAKRVQCIVAPGWQHPELAAGERVEDLFPGEGPLGGILTALRASDKEWVFVLATDMPLVEAKVIAALRRAWRPGCNAVIAAQQRPDGGRQWQPLAAYYHRETAEVIAEHFAAGLRKVVTAIEWLRVEPVFLPKRHFLNANTPEEFSLLQEQAALLQSAAEGPGEGEEPASTQP